MNPHDEVHEFWDTQPVPKVGERVAEEGPVETKTLDDVPKEPYALPDASYEWWVPSIDDKGDMRAVYELLRDNYVEDNGSMFRFNYSVDFLRWALSPPGYHHEWHVAVRKKDGKKLLAFISGIPFTTKMGDTVKRICEINFLCVHKQLRAKRLAPILIKEVTRRVNLTDVWQAIYTAGRFLPQPFCTANYYHRSLNPEKLIAVNFSRIPPSYTKFAKPMEMVKRNYTLPPKTSIRGLREMVKEDVPSVTTVLNDHLKKYKVASVFTEEEVAHWLLPRKEVVYCYVIGEPGGSITDFFSFYSLPSTIIGHPKYNLLRAAYLFYYVANTVSVRSLLNDLLIKARDLNFDVCNCVDILRNAAVVEELKFAPGDGSLHYYFYNWRYPLIEPKECGLVML